MREYQHKYIIRTLAYSKVTIVVLFLLVVLLLRSIMELNAKRKDVAVLKNESATERQELENKVSIARNKNELIKTERGFEEYVRTTYPVVKEGEGVVVVYDEEKTLVSKVREDTSFFEKISIFWNRFLNKNNTPPSVE